jgi:dipeptidyl aminopeptidase/acylaminoacyl peptidase
VLTASWDKTARVWDARNGKALTEPLRHEGEVYSAQFSPDGTRVVTASLDETARVWDARSGKALTEPLRHEDKVLSVQFSPDGTRVVTASDDNTARVWDVFTVSPSDAEIVASLAEAVVGYRVNEQGLVARITDAVDRLAKLREEVKDATEADGNGRAFVRWFLADRWTRTLSPMSKVTVPEHIQRLIDAGKTDEAVGEFPGHPLLLKLHQPPTPAVPSADKATDTLSQPWDRTLSADRTKPHLPLHSPVRRV